MRKRVLTTVIVVGLSFFLAGCTKAGEFFEKGQVSYSDGDYENALHYFSQAVEENPDKAEYYIEQGYCLTALGRFS